MRQLRTPRQRAIFGALAIFGAALNVWVLTVHVTSVALAALHADGTAVVICHQGGVTSVVDLGLAGSQPIQKKRCPICSGHATLHLGFLTDPGTHIALPTAPMTAIVQTISALVIDRRPQLIFNRGPPLGA